MNNSQKIQSAVVVESWPHKDAQGVRINGTAQEIVN